jgi:hypothetical protein
MCHIFCVLQFLGSWHHPLAWGIIVWSEWDITAQIAIGNGVSCLTSVVVSSCLTPPTTGNDDLFIGINEYNSNYIRRYPKLTNIVYIHRFGLSTDKYMGRPVWLWLAPYIHRWCHITDKYTWLIFVGDVATNEYMGGVRADMYGPLYLFFTFTCGFNSLLYARTFSLGRQLTRLKPASCSTMLHGGWSRAPSCTPAASLLPPTTHKWTYFSFAHRCWSNCFFTLAC